MSSSLIPRSIDDDLSAGPFITKGHDAYSHYYLPTLKDRLRTGPGAYQVQVIRFATRDMTDQDCIAIAAALRSSFEENGALDCSARALREVGLSGNEDVSSHGVEVVLEALVVLAEGSLGEEPKNAAEMLNDEDLNESIGSQSALCQLHTVDLAQLSHPLSVASQALLMRLLRAAPSLRHVKLPESLWENESEVRAAVAEEIAALDPLIDSEVEQSKVMTSAGYAFYYGASRLYTREQVSRVAELGEFPLALRNAVLFCGGWLRPKTSRLHFQRSLQPCDIERDFPASYSLLSVRALSDVMAFNRSIVYLDFSCQQLGDDKTIVLAAFLRTNGTLAELRLRSNQIGTKGGLALSEAINAGPNKALVELDLTDNNVNDIVVQSLLKTVQADITALGIIHLEKNCVTPALIQKVYHALMLNTQIPAMKKIVPLLEANDRFATKVSLDGGEENALDDMSMKVLLQSLRNNNQVTSIDVSNNRITDEGALFLAEMMLTVPSLRTIKAQFNRIGEEGARKLLVTIPGTKNVESVDLKFQEPPIAPQLLLMIEKVAGLSNQPKVVRESGLGLAENDPTLTSLDLSVPDADDGRLKRCNDETIQTLHILMSENTNVTSLNLSSNAGRLTLKSSGLIADLAMRLKFLDLSINGLNDAMIEPLCDALMKPGCMLQTLHLDHNELSSQSAHNFLTILRLHNDTVTTLTLAGNRQIPKPSQEMIQYYCDLNTHSKAFKSLIRSVEDNVDPRLTTLDFCVIDKIGGSGTAHGFRKEFGDLSARLICIALAQNSTVKTVKMCGNRVTDVGANYFAKLLETNVSIDHLDLRYNELTDVGLSLLCQALKANSTVKVFLYEGNKLEDPALKKSLQHALQGNTLSANSANVYTTALNMTAVKGNEKRDVDPKLQAHAVQQMVSQAILDDALKDAKRYS